MSDKKSVRSSSCICKVPEPRIKNSENGVSAYCFKCAKQYYKYGIDPYTLD